MSDRTGRAFAAWRDATEHARAPIALADEVWRAPTAPTLADLLASLAQPALVAGSLAAIVLASAAVSAVHEFTRDAADYVLSRAP
jgi:hypothetical protein